MERVTYTIDETAAVLGVSRDSVRKLQRNGSLVRVPHLRRNLTPVYSLERFLKQGPPEGGEAA